MSHSHDEALAMDADDTNSVQWQPWMAPLAAKNSYWNVTLDLADSFWASVAQDYALRSQEALHVVHIMSCRRPLPDSAT